MEFRLQKQSETLLTDTMFMTRGYKDYDINGGYFNQWPQVSPHTIWIPTNSKTEI